MSDDYDVGYGKPPFHTRWPKGTSGNPQGREKGHRGLKSDLEATLNSVQTIENRLTGKKSKARNQLHAVERLVERAALGDLKAQALLFPMVLSVLGAEDRHVGPRKLSTLDEHILSEVLGERAADLELQVPLLTDGRVEVELPFDDEGLSNTEAANDDED